MKFENDFSVAYINRRSNVLKTLETVSITLLLIFLVYLMLPQDSFLMMGPVPWLSLIPMFFSLLYGTLFGLLSLAVLLVFMLIQHPVTDVSSLIAYQYVIASICITLLAGAFSSYWVNRIRHVEYLNRYVREHLDNLSREYFTLRVSHERIEQNYIIKPKSIRDVFFQIKQEIIKNNYEINQQSSQILLELFGQFCSVNNASFCLYDEKNKHIQSVSYLGKEFPIQKDDPLVVHAIKNQSSAYVALTELIDRNSSQYLAVIPLINSENSMMGMVLIKDMPFWSFTHDNLEILTIMSAYFALQWNTLKNIAPLPDEFPTCPSDFLSELQTLASLKKNYNIDSALTCLIVPPGTQQQKIAYLMERQRRSLDYIWVYHHESYVYVITLIPIMNLEGVFGYQERISALLKREFGQIVNENGLNFRFEQLNSQSTSKQLSDFIEVINNAK